DAVEAAGAALARVGGAVEPSAEAVLAVGGVERDRGRERARPRKARHVGELRPAQAPAGREQRQRLEEVRLAGPVLADERDAAAREREVEAVVVAEVLQNEARDAGSALVRAHRNGRGHTRIGIST